MGELIPLFPLGTPLFPGVVLPLQIFEPRYRRLMRDLLAHARAGDRRFFGVVAIRQGWEVEQVAPAEALYDIGCTARLQAVRPQSDGGFRIVTVGGDRFRLLDVVVGDDPPYLQAEVEWLAEEEAAEEAAGDADGLVADPGARPLGAPERPQPPPAWTRWWLGGPGLDGRPGPRRARPVHPVRGRGGRPRRRRRRGRGASRAVDAETAVLLGAVADDPRRCPTWWRRRPC